MRLPDQTGLWSAARAAWPGVELAPEVFWRYVDARAGDCAPPALRTDELYLTCACAGGDPRAHALLEVRYFPRVVAALSRLRLGSSGTDEVKQQLRVRLLAGKPPRIAEYAGRGELGSWLQVIAVRLALRLVRAQAREVGADDALLDAFAAGGDVERGHLERLYRAPVRAALCAAFSSLGAREKNLLGHYYLDGLTLVEVARLYGVHRLTVGRWLDAIRQRLLDGTRRALAARLGASARDGDSLVRLVHSQLEITLPRLLQTQ